MDLSVYELAAFFFIYGFLGWCTEVCFQALSKGKLVNRGFLNGAICPIYGVGVVSVVWLLEPLASHGLALFFASIVLCSLLEWITGFVLEKLFHQKWWDYSDEPFNIGGYICPRFSIMWGFACVFVVYIVHPTIAWLASLVPHTLGIVLLSLLGAAFITDCAATVKTMIGFNRELRRIDEGAAKLKEISDDLTEALYEGAVRAREEAEKAREETEEFKAKVSAEKAQLEIRRKELEKKLTYGQRRLLKAFPGVKSTRHIEAMEEMKRRLDEYIKTNRR
ncbi:putative ABC transporter permease [Anaerovorax odorimutans]|uniref:ABC transporter permease n=1 Tax=Anaerovorax odorimutans TaxID=109327 RepID=A0ABT1RLY9_9FIRM|nr:putative ABC transporter permease [Anaerovorax odorimutans]MCQ4636198.1 putative ABC transporter permease [Anaerovorax odorimutans]